MTRSNNFNRIHRLSGLLAAGALAVVAQAAVLHVPGDYATIQAALDAAAQTGDEIIVAPGTYPEAINFLGKAVNLHSSGGPAVTIIDATGLNTSVVTCVSGEGPGTVLEGFTITGGWRRWGLGGGVCCYFSSPTLTNCTITGNTACYGGGVYGCSSNPTLTNCTITGNTADDGSGGGVCCESNSNATLTNCTITGNTAYGGGGVWGSSSNPTLTNCTITDNSASMCGGGVGCIEGSNPALTNCTITGNSASNCGGGVNAGGSSSPALTNCTITENTASYGAGLWCDNSVPTLTNCTVTGNTANEHGGGVGCYSSTPTLTNCILWANLPEEIYVESSSPVVTYCDVQGGWSGTGNIDADPGFAFPTDLHLLPGSPCIDAGTNTPLGGLPPEDPEGQPRSLDGDGDGRRWRTWGSTNSTRPRRRWPSARRSWCTSYRRARPVRRRWTSATAVWAS